LTIFHTVVGHKRRCSACGKVQVVERLDKDQRYHCKFCGHRFTKEELQARPPS
jgi:DNA-directed RNA polymerase subunit RPC12/RpoP